MVLITLTPTPTPLQRFLQTCAFTMIYFTTFIFTLLLSHITRAVPACGNAASPKDLYDTTNDDVQQPFDLPLPTINVTVTWSSFYDNPNGDTKTLVCPERVPHFKDIHDFPLIGGASDIKNKTSFVCNRCWRLYNPKTSVALTIFAVDAAKTVNAATTVLNVSKTAFEVLNLLHLVPSLEMEATPCLLDSN